MKDIKIKKAILLLIPFSYSILFIIYPIYALDMNYAMSMVVLFWLPVAIMLGINWNWMVKQNLFRPFLYSNIIMGIVSIPFEYMSIGMAIWDFSEKYHKQLGIKIIGIPIEEFMFWFGATPFCILCFICFYRILCSQSKTRRISRKTSRVIFSIWAILALIFVPIAITLHTKIKKQYKEESAFAWSPITLATAVFWLTLIFVEHHSIICGHWVFNEARLWGIYIWQIPVEEFVFYTIGPIFVILLLHFMELKPVIIFESSKSNISKPNMRAPIKQ